MAVLFAAAMNVASSAHALLLDRGPDMVYDNVLNITWTRQAGDGVQRNWADAKSWAANLVVDGISGWRLPYVSVTAGDGPATTVVDCLFATEQVCRGNEYGYMYYWNLGGSFGSDLTGTHTAIGGQVITGIQPLTFQVQEGYWSATGFNPNLSWLFFYSAGVMNVFDTQRTQLYSWAVHNGDIAAPVPEPATVALVGLGIAGLGLSRRRAARA